MDGSKRASNSISDEKCGRSGEPRGHAIQQRTNRQCDGRQSATREGQLDRRHIWCEAVL
jgi:hypothetical protein